MPGCPCEEQVAEVIIAEGKAQGEHDKQQEIARSMKRDGLPAGTIARYTGLAAEDIEKLVTEDD